MVTTQVVTQHCNSIETSVSDLSIFITYTHTQSVLNRYHGDVPSCDQSDCCTLPLKRTNTFSLVFVKVVIINRCNHETQSFTRLLGHQWMVCTQIYMHGPLL